MLREHIINFLEALAMFEALTIAVLVALIALLVIDPAAITSARRRTSERVRALVGARR